MKTLAILTFSFLFLSSCSSRNKNQSEEEETQPKITGPEKRVVGRIASVSKAGEFVLIQKFGPGTLPKNTLYQSQGPQGRAASLRPSGERVRDFYAADLVSGDVEKGDAVIGYPDFPEKAEITTEIPQPTAVESKITP